MCKACDNPLPPQPCQFCGEPANADPYGGPCCTNCLEQLPQTADSVLKAIDTLSRSYGCWPVREVTDRVDAWCHFLKRELDSGCKPPAWDRYPHGRDEYRWLMGKMGGTRDHGVDPESELGKILRQQGDPTGKLQLWYDLHSPFQRQS